MPGRIRSEIVDRVREATNVVDLVGAYVGLKRSGRNYKGLCPFHDEKSPSFSVMADRGRYHCFGCGQKGNVFDFVMAMDRLTFPDAVEMLADKAGIVVEREEGTEPAREGPSKQDFFRLNRWAAEFYKRRLASPQGAACQAYVDKRGLSAESSEDFGLGYAPASWDALVGAAARKGIPESLLVEAGLAKPRENRGGCYDAFRDRLIFPIRDALDRVIGFGGRSLDGSEPKYLNSPETPVFSKRRSVYGLDRLRGLRPENPLLVMEGYTDVIMSVQAASAFAIATLGTALTEEHAQLLSRYSKKIVLVYDGDSAGRKAAERGAELFTSVDLDLEIALLPGGQDPCDFFSERGPGGLEELLGRARDFYGFVLGEVRERHDVGDIAGKVRAADELLALARSATNPVKRDVLLDRIAVDLELSRSVLEERMRDFGAPRRAPESPARPAAPPTPAPEPEVTREAPRSRASRRAEKQVLEAIMNGAGEGIPWSDRLAPGDFSAGPSRRVFGLLVERALTRQATDAEAVLSDCENEQDRLVVNQLVVDADGDRLLAFEHQLSGAIEHLRHERRQRELAKLKEGGVTEENFADMVARVRAAKRKKVSEEGGEAKPRTSRPPERSKPAEKPIPEAPTPTPWESDIPPDVVAEGEEDDLDFF